MGIGRRQLGKTPERQELGCTETVQKHKRNCTHTLLQNPASQQMRLPLPFSSLSLALLKLSYSFVIPWEPCVTQLPLPSLRPMVFPSHTHQTHVSRERLLRDKQCFPAFLGASNQLCSRNILFSLREKLWY